MSEIGQVLRTHKIQPVLLDIGASGQPPACWDPIAEFSTYIGFDPDQRELHEVPQGRFARSIIVNEAVTSDEDVSEATFFLTRSPFCSSTLRPDSAALAKYLFSNLFEVERTVTVKASHLNALFSRLDLSGVDWFKTDSQGTDLRLFQSIASDVRSRVLAVDVEPGLIDAYQGEDLFVDTHRRLTAEGFWLSSQDVKGTVRMERASFETIRHAHQDVSEADIYNSVRSSPAWCEARYLRTLDSLADRQAVERDYVLLWVFAVMEEQWGFAIDIALAYRALFRDVGIARTLSEFPLSRILSKTRASRSAAGRLGSRLRQLIKG